MFSTTSPANEFPNGNVELPTSVLPTIESSSTSICRIRVVVAGSWWLRARGLLARPVPGPGEGMLFPGCTSVHTAFMGYAIDVVFLDRASVITKVANNVRPWRFSAAARGTRHVLELAAGEADRLGLTVGGRLGIDTDSDISWTW